MIIAAAAALLNKQGQNRTSLAAVAQQLGLTKQAIYHYFKDKQALLFAGSMTAHQGALRVAEAALAAQGSPVRRLSWFLQQYALHVVKGNYQPFMFLETHEFTPEQVREILHCRDAFDQALRTLVQWGIDDGSLRACDPKFASLTVLGAVNWIARWYRPGGPRALEDVVADVVYYALTGIATDAAELAADAPERAA